MIPPALGTDEAGSGHPSMMTRLRYAARLPLARRENPTGTIGWRAAAPVAVSLGGYALTLGILAWGFGSGRFAIPGGDALIWDRVGDALRSGGEVYYRTPTLSDSFWYAPPWAVVFAAVSWLPVQVTALAIIAAEVAALRYIAGSWLRVGYLCWFPLVAFELPSSQFNLIMAAAIAAALRGDPRAAVVMGAAKLSPILAIDPRAWRKAAPVGLALLAVTLPWWGLWPAWIGHLVSSYGANLAPGATILVPLAPRLLIALALVVWSSGRGYPGLARVALMRATRTHAVGAEQTGLSVLETPRIAEPNPMLAPARPADVRREFRTDGPIDGPRRRIGGLLMIHDAAHSTTPALLVRRPWARGLAAIVATPSLYWVSGVLLLGLVPDRATSPAMSR